jgi:hypothetical protein
MLNEEPVLCIVRKKRSYVVSKLIDFTNFAGNKSHFSLVFSLEVCEGTLTLSLPAITIPTVEMKTGGVNQWQPLQTYVNIDNHFVLKGTAVRFRGTVQDCNNAMQQLHYQVLIFNPLGSFQLCIPRTSIPCLDLYVAELLS